MRQVLFVQGGGEGAYGADAQLVASLRNALGAAYAVHYPRMPSQDDPDYTQWKVRIGKELAALKGAVILISHSLGGSFLLKYLSEANIKSLQ